VDTTDGVGNLRILPIKFNESDPNAAFKYLEETFQNSLLKNSKKTKIGNSMCISFTENIELTELSVHYWFLEKNNFVFIVSFTIPIETEGIETDDQRVQEIINIIGSLKTLECRNDNM
jgi:hypothetical protein